MVTGEARPQGGATRDKDRGATLGTESSDLRADSFPPTEPALRKVSTTGKQSNDSIKLDL